MRAAAMVVRVKPDRYVPLIMVVRVVSVMTEVMAVLAVAVAAKDATAILKAPI